MTDRMITDSEIWACAHMVLQHHGDDAPTFVAKRIGALAVKGDVEGVKTWKQIAHRMAQLMRRPASLS